jgi:hypothetical protein
MNKFNLALQACHTFKIEAGRNRPEGKPQVDAALEMTYYLALPGEITDDFRLSDAGRVLMRRLVRHGQEVTQVMAESLVEILADEAELGHSLLLE